MTYKSTFFIFLVVLRFFLFPKRIELVRQIAERHADDGDDDVGDGRPNVQYLNEEFQAEVINEDVTDSDKKIPDNLRPAFQRRARETDMARHPEAREESDGELEHEGRDVGREGDETKVKHLSAEDEMVKNIVQHPLQNKVQATAGRITEQFETHHLAERRIEEVDELRQGAFHPGFYVAEG